MEEEVRGILEEWINEILMDSDDDTFFNSSTSSSSSSEEQSSLDEEENSSEDGDHERHCIKFYVEFVVNFYTEREFKGHFRLKRASAYHLIDLYRQTNFLHVNEHIPQQNHEKALLMTLWYLANLETFRQVADRFDMSRSTSHDTLNFTLDFLVSLADRYIQWPAEIEEKRFISREFAAIKNIHGIIGAIDGCHVRIRRSLQYEQDYCNRKKYHSVILQAVVTSRRLFTDVYIGEPGSMHDARVLRKSPLYERAQEDPRFFDNFFLLGDSAYPNLPWLVPIFKDNGHLTDDQVIFNNRHSSTRIRVEHAFGLLKGRFRRLLGFHNLRLDIIVRCILASCILHNLCLLSRFLEDVSDSETDVSSINSGFSNGYSSSEDELEENRNNDRRN